MLLRVASVRKQSVVLADDVHNSCLIGTVTHWHRMVVLSACRQPVSSAN